MKDHTASLSEVHGTVSTKKKKGFRRVLAFFGPAFLISVGYMDPGNWATDIAGGSAFGYKLIWVLLASNLMAILLQSLSTRLGIASGLDLAQANRQVYPRWANFPLWILAEIAIAATDLAEVIGLAIGLNLLFHIPLAWGIIISGFDTIVFLFLMHKGIRVMEAFIISLVSIIGISFLVEMFIVEPVYSEVIKGFIPSELSGSALYISIGIIGATVMPHNLYLHSSLVQTREIGDTDDSKKKAIRMNLLDTTVALNAAFFVNAAILILAAAAFHARGFVEIAEIQDASVMLENLFGKTAPIFFGLALIAAGQSSTVTGTLAGQIVMEGHLNLRIQPWLRRLITRVVAIVPAMFTVIYFGESTLGQLLVFSQVILSLQLGFAVIPLIHFTSNKKLMGKFAINIWIKMLAWGCAIFILYLNIMLVAQEVKQWKENGAINPTVINLVLLPLAFICLVLMGYILIHPWVGKKREEVVRLPHGIAETLMAAATHPFTNILIAVDFSGKDQKIIQNALKQGGTTGKYTIVHIVESAAARYLDREAYDRETKADTESLRIYSDKLREVGFEVQSNVSFGNPAHEIAKIAKDKEVDLIVMGAHGHRAIKDLIFGSVADRLRHLVNVPVLIVK